MAHVCSYDGRASGQSLFAMDQNRSSFGEGLMNEVAGGREVNEDVRVILVFDRNPQLSDPASRNVSWNGVRADGHDVSDPPLRYGSRSASSDQAAGETCQERSDGKEDKAPTFQARAYHR